MYSKPSKVIMQKRIFIIMIVVICLSNLTYAQTKRTSTKTSQTKQQIAEKLVGQYMLENLNDFKSYEPISYSLIDTLMSKLIFTETLADYVINKLGKYNQFVDNNPEDKRTLEVAKLMIPSTNIILSLNQTYPKIPIGWMTIHKCRSIDKVGRLKLGEWTFGFDLDMTKIIYIESDFPEKKIYISDSYLAKFPVLNEANKLCKTIIDDYDLIINKLISE